MIPAEAGRTSPNNRYGTEIQLVPRSIVLSSPQPRTDTRPGWPSNYKARLVGLHVVEMWKYPFADHAAYETGYARFSQAMNEGGIPVIASRRNLRFGKEMPPNRILSFAESENIEVIVMGTHRRRGFDRLVLGSRVGRLQTHHRVQ